MRPGSRKEAINNHGAKNVAGSLAVFASFVLACADPRGLAGTAQLRVRDRLALVQALVLLHTLDLWLTGNGGVVGGDFRGVLLGA